MKFLKQYNHNILMLLVRVGVGLAFVYHGYDKVTNIEGFTGFLTSLGLGGIFMAWIVAVAELVGGLFILAGVYTTYAGPILSVIMLFAIFGVHFKNGFNTMAGGYEYQLLLLLCTIGLTLSGPGAYSLWGGKCGCPTDCSHDNNKCTV